MSRRTEVPIRPRRESNAFGGLLALGLGVLLMSLLAAVPAPAGDMTDCRLTVGPGSLEAGGEAVEIRLIASEETGEIQEVSFEPGSGLAARVMSHDPLVLLVDPSDADPGRWEITLRGEEGAVCTGTLTVDG
jgi:hypothetical protein